MDPWCAQDCPHGLRQPRLIWRDDSGGSNESLEADEGVHFQHEQPLSLFVVACPRHHPEACRDSIGPEWNLNSDQGAKYATWEFRDRDDTPIQVWGLALDITLNRTYREIE